MLKNNLLENTPQTSKQNLFMKVATKLGMLSATHERVTVPVGRVKKIWTALRANQIVGFVTVPPWEKINFDISDYSSAITIASFLL